MARTSQFVVQQFTRVVLYLADVFGNLEGLHFVSGKRVQHVDQRLVGWFAIELAVEIAGVQDDGCAVVDRCEQLVCLGCDDGVAAANGCSEDPSMRPTARRRPSCSIGEVEGEGLFVLCIELSQAVPSLGTQEECLSLTERPPSR